MVDNVADPETGLAVGLRVFGDYSLKVVAPDRLILNLVGTQDLHRNEQITDWMRDQLAAAAKVLDAYGISVARMGNFVISIRPEDEETLKNYRRDVQSTKLAGSFQGAAAGEAMEGIGEGAANGAEGSAPAVVAGMGLAGVVFSAAGAAAKTAPCPRCGACGRGEALFQLRR